MLAISSDLKLIVTLRHDPREVQQWHKIAMKALFALHFSHLCNGQ